MHPRASRFASLRAFRYPAYLRIWTGAFVSNVGTWIQAVSVGVYVSTTTGKAGWTGSITAMAWLPAVFLGPLGGALADRFDRRRVIVPLQIAQALTAAALAILSARGQLSLPPLMALLFISGCASALSSPAFNALLSEIVEPEDLLSSVSLSSAQFNLARIVGPMCAAAILTWRGITFSFLANALSYLAVVVAVAITPLPAGRRRSTDGLWEGVAGGVRVAQTDPGIRLALPLVLAIAVLIAPFIGLMPAYAIHAFGKSEGAASLMAMAQGMGALVFASTANAVAQRWGIQTLLSRSLLVVGPVAAAYWLAPTYSVAFALLGILGGVYMWTLTALSTTCMGRVSRNLQARMSSLYGMTLSGGYSLGLIAQGWLEDRFGLRRVPVAAAGLVFVLALILRRRRAFEAIEASRAFGDDSAAP